MAKDTVAAEKGRSARKRMTIFKRGDETEMGPETMPMEGIDAGVMAGLAKLRDVGIARGAGDKTTILFSLPGDKPMSLAYAWFKSGYVLPRHSHNADCVYYILGGTIKLGTVTLGKGEGFFVPENDGYSYEVGPEGVEVLEFRNAVDFNFVFKGNDEAHWDRMARAQRENAPHWADEPAPFTPA